MSTPKINERAWAIEVITEVNRLVATRNCTIRSAGGEWSVAVKKEETVLFPDVLLFGDPTRTAVLQGWELKMPDTPITDGELIENAEKKARELGLGSFLIWNAREAVLYVAENGTFNGKKSWCCNAISCRADIQPQRACWLRLLEDILDSLNGFFASGAIAETHPLNRQTELVVNAIVGRRQGQLAEALKMHAASSRDWRADVTAWWRDASVEHSGQDEWTVLAIEVLLHWVHRFLFAHYLKRFVNDARAVEKLTPDASPSIATAEKVFANLSQRHDFVQLFRSRSGANLLPVPVWAELLSFNAFLRSASIDQIGPELLHSVINSVKQASQRKAAGQFCTPRPLADLLVRLTMDDVHAPVLDPCCGTGTIAKAAYEYKVLHGMSPVHALATTWASDKHAMPLQFATLALATGEAPAATMQVFQHDLTTLRTGERIPLVDPNNGRKLSVPLPCFPAIVLNPPFVRFEEWARNNPAATTIANKLHKLTGVQLDGKSDLFAPLVLHLWQLASGDNARVGVLVSNSWLGTEWGVVFRTALLRLFRLEAVIASAKGRWFTDAKVVTNILVLRRRTRPSCPNKTESVVFASTKQHIRDWTTGTVDEIASAIVKKSMCDSTAVSITNATISHLQSFDNLGLCWTAHFADLSWFNRVVPHLEPVSSFFDIGRGERRGWDRLFFPPGDSGIESEHLHPVLKSSADAPRLCVVPDGNAFCCSHALDDLARLNHRGAVQWIGRFAKATNEKGTLLPKVLARSGMHWYEMRPDAVADLAAAMNYDRRLFVMRLTPRAFVNQRLIRLTAKAGVKVDIDLCHALLCSLMGAFYIEALGFGRGLGVLDLNATKFGRQMRLLNPNKLSAEKRRRILVTFAPLLKRDILSFEDEMKQRDRIVFETAVLNAFGLANIRPKIERAVRRLQAIRLTAREGAPAARSSDGPNSD
ncbi:MAG: N-6 DNA methylase [Kiritimatiellia bacterium]